MKIKWSVEIEIKLIFVKIIIISIMLPAALAVGGAALQGLSLINSYLEKKKAEQEAARLNNLPVPEYSLSPAFLGQKRIASNMFSSPQGLTPEEYAKYDRNIRRNFATSTYNGTNIGGGGVGRVISAMNNANGVNAATDLAATDANLIRENKRLGFNTLNNIANKEQSIQDMNTQNEYNRRLMAMQAAGAAIRTNKDYINGAISGIGSDLLSAGLTKSLMPKDTVLPTETAIPVNNSMYGGRRINPNLINNMPPNFSFSDINSANPNFRTERVNYSRRNPITTLDYNERLV